jgi:hypothetical protein
MAFDPYDEAKWPPDTICYAKKELELTNDETEWLFFPWDDDGISNDELYTSNDAIDRLNWLITRGTIEGYQSPHIGFRLPNELPNHY